MAYDFFKLVREGSRTFNLPKIKLSPSNSDKFELYVLGKTRFDILAYKYYGDASLRDFILLGNPEYIDEWSIPDGTKIRIPFPKSRCIEEYERKLRLINKL